MTIEQMEERIKELEAIESEAAKLKEAADAIKEELKAELDRRKEDCVETFAHKVFYNCYVQNRVDSAKLKKAGLYDQFSKESTVLQFRITQKAVV